MPFLKHDPASFVDGIRITTRSLDGKERHFFAITVICQAQYNAQLVLTHQPCRRHYGSIPRNLLPDSMIARPLN